MNIENLDDVREVFKYHAPDEDAIARYRNIREKARELGEVILMFCPESWDRNVAFMKLREAVMFANASVALEGKKP